ncbi:Cenp-O kinetochore centromere component-domain-containing protein [Apiospora rasikravindrae]|uniref:Cenp-O kinetochore centromere component-domain-containing protein n=1 Tax=Apiospora rasikravindrae TaxID=990691 RepID=A0ABR1S3A4_9PEZI
MSSSRSREESLDLSIADQLDDEIASLRAQVESLKKELKIQTSTLMVSEPTRKLLQDRSKKRTVNSLDSGPVAELLKKSDEQVAHQQQCLYRSCASITALKIRDPDPNAVDGGNVLGLRFEVMSKARFVRPYYVMLNRPYPNSRHLRVHRHTVPPCVPLAGLAARHLPAPKPKGGEANGDDDDDEPHQEQDLPRFARALRRELVRYQNRIGIVGDLHKAVEQKNSQASEVLDDDTVKIQNISPADAEAKQISVEWSDGKAGRLIIDDDGKIVKMAVQGEQGRDRGAARDLIGGNMQIEELMGRLEGT